MRIYKLFWIPLGIYISQGFMNAKDRGKEIMVWLGKNESDMPFKTEQFSRHDEITPKDSFAFFEDEPLTCPS
jgi:hypothetical protein